MKWLRWLRVAIVVLAGAQIGFWTFAGWVGWDLRYLMIGLGSPEVVNRERFAIALFVVAAINLIALVSLLSGVRWGWWLLTFVQVGDLCMSVYEAISRSTDWWLVTLIAGMTTVLLLTWRWRRPASLAT